VERLRNQVRQEPRVEQEHYQAVVCAGQIWLP